MKAAAIALAVIAALTPRPSAAQSLGAVAQQEEARRATVRQPSKTYTNGDLRSDPSGPPSTNASSNAPVGAAPPTGYVSKTTGQQLTAEEMVAASQALLTNEEKKTDEGYWRARAKMLRGEVDRLRSRVESLTNAENADSPAQVTALKNAQAALADAEKMWARFETQAGVAKVPKAWIAQ